MHDMDCFLLPLLEEAEAGAEVVFGTPLLFLLRLLLLHISSVALVDVPTLPPDALLLEPAVSADCFRLFGINSLAFRNSIDLDFFREALEEELPSLLPLRRPRW